MEIWKIYRNPSPCSFTENHIIPVTVTRCLMKKIYHVHNKRDIWSHDSELAQTPPSF